MNRLGKRALLALLPAMAAYGCQSGADDRPGLTALGESPPEQICIDGDEDGFGFGCDRGSDCDDEDSSVTTECACDVPRPGCDCAIDAELAACGRVYSKIGEQLICGEGVTACNNGV